MTQPADDDRFDYEAGRTEQEAPAVGQSSADQDPEATGGDVEGGEEVGVREAAQAERENDPES